jgi:hypothetical protein
MNQGRWLQAMQNLTFGKETEQFKTEVTNLTTNLGSRTAYGNMLNAMRAAAKAAFMH